MNGAGGEKSGKMRGFNLLVLAIACLGAVNGAAGQEGVAARPPAAAQTVAPKATTTMTVDHSVYDALLRRHVVNGEVDYAAFARDSSFVRYLASLDRVDPTTLDEEERIAFWINVYNAYTIHLVAQHGEKTSIRNINKTLGVLQLKGPWSTPIVRAAGRTLSLDAVQHRILRKEFNEPRIHFALVYAAKGSPPLRSEAYRGATLEAQLQDQGRRFLREASENNRMDRLDYRLRLLMVSPVLMTYRRDIAVTRADLGKFLAPWFEGEDREALEKGAFRLRETEFDWGLNGPGSRTPKPGR